MSSPLPTLLFAMPTCGAASEIWLQRQISGMRRFQPHLLYWQSDGAWEVKKPSFKAPGLPPSRRGESVPARWLHRLRTLPSGNTFASIGHHRAHLLSLAAEATPSAILAHFGHTGLCFAPVAREIGVPLIVHFHGNDLSQALGNRWYRRSLLATLPSFDAIVVVGSHQRKWMLDHGVPPDRVHLIPCGAPVEEFTPGPEREDGRVVFITVSRLDRQKGLHLSIEAFARILPDHPEAELRIVGAGKARGALEQQVRDLGLSEHVTFLGSRSPAEVRKELAQASVFLQHSLDLEGCREGFGVSITEAAAMQLPVVVSNAGSISDQVIEGETGYVVAQNDIRAMAAAMIHLATDPEERYRMGRNGRENAKRNFNTPKQIAKLEDVLMSVISGEGFPNEALFR